MKTCLLSLCCLLALPALAYPDLRLAFKVSGLAAEGGESELPARFRLMAMLQPAPGVSGEIAYELRGRIGGVGQAGAGILPADAPPPYRIVPLEGALVTAGELTVRQELDRAFLTAHPGRADMTVGRQAIGLGRGVLLSAVDVFSPFSPLEVDREWRRGVDAVNAGYRLSPRAAAGGVAVFGEDWDRSAVIGRLRGNAGNVDAELLAGKRAEDTMYGAVASAAVGGAEAHGEAAVFHVPEGERYGGFLGNERLVGKVVLGTSYNFKAGNGVWVLAEYAYSGFGGRTPAEIAARLLDPAFQARLLRGDTQILGREAVAVQALTSLEENRTVALTWLANPRDGSGVVTPTLNWDIDDWNSLVLSVYLPYGRPPAGGVLRSEYGGAPASMFVQWRYYR